MLTRLEDKMRQDFLHNRQDTHAPRMDPSHSTIDLVGDKGHYLLQVINLFDGLFKANVVNLGKADCSASLTAC
jgi:hypothetical protein